MGRRLDNNSLPEQTVQGYTSEVLQNRRTLEVQDQENHRITRYLFVDLKVDKYGSDPSRIVAITYDIQLIQDALNRLILFQIVAGIAALVIGVPLHTVFREVLPVPLKRLSGM